MSDSAEHKPEFLWVRMCGVHWPVQKITENTVFSYSDNAEIRIKPEDILKKFGEGDDQHKIRENVIAILTKKKKENTKTCFIEDFTWVEGAHAEAKTKMTRFVTRDADAQQPAETAATVMPDSQGGFLTETDGAQAEAKTKMTRFVTRDADAQQPAETAATVMPDSRGGFLTETDEFIIELQEKVATTTSQCEILTLDTHDTGGGFLQEVFTEQVTTGPHNALPTRNLHVQGNSATTGSPDEVVPRDNQGGCSTSIDEFIAELQEKNRDLQCQTLTPETSSSSEEQDLLSEEQHKMVTRGPQNVTLITDGEMSSTAVPNCKLGKEVAKGETAAKVSLADLVTQDSIDEAVDSSVESYGESPVLPHMSKLYQKEGPSTSDCRETMTDTVCNFFAARDGNDIDNESYCSYDDKDSDYLPMEEDLASSSESSDESPTCFTGACETSEIAIENEAGTSDLTYDRPVVTSDVEGGKAGSMCEPSLVDSNNNSEVPEVSDIPLDECEIVRDKNCPGIYVRKIKKVELTRNRKTSRVQNSVHACLFCQKLVQHIPVHMSYKHKEEDQVKEALANKQASKDIFAFLRSKGDHIHNLQVVKCKKGELLVHRRPKTAFDHEMYGTCSKCYDWVIKSSLPSHVKTCQGYKAGVDRPRKGDLLTQSDLLQDRIKHSPSKTMKKEVFGTMKNDHISTIAKNDFLILQLGESWLRRNVSNVVKRRYYASEHMRHCARLLSALREKESQQLKSDNTSNKVESSNPENMQKSLWEYLRPAYFSEIVQAALDTAALDDEEELKSPSNAIKIKYDLLRMVNTKLTLAIRENDKKPNPCWVKAKAEAEEFLSSVKIEWAEQVTRLAQKILNERKLNKLERIPKPTDIQKLSEHLTHKLATTDLSKRNVTWPSYKAVAQTVLTRLLTYNKRRSGELEATKMSSFVGRKKAADIDDAIMGELTDTDKFLLESHDLMEIRGKNDRRVPVLIPQDTIKALEFLSDPKVRLRAEVSTNNIYLFPNQRDSTQRAYDCLKSTCTDAGLQAPERITSVTMRHYMATLTQVLKLKNNELDWVVRHLGHTKDVHLQHYRMTSPYLERVMVGKLLLMQDLNIQNSYIGKALNDIEFPDIIEAAERRTDLRRSIEVHQDTEVDTPAKDDEHDQDELEDECDEFEPRRKRPKIQVKRQAWTVDEEDELRKYLRENFKRKVTPGRPEVQQAQQLSKENGGVIHLRTIPLIIKKCSNMIKKLKNDA